MSVAANLLAIPSDETPAPVQAMEEIPISKAEYEIDKKMDNMMQAFKVTRGEAKWARSEEEVPEVSTSAGNQDKRTIRKAGTFSKQPAMADLIENMFSKSPMAAKLPRQKAPALNTRNYKVLGSSHLDFTIVACQERETGKLIFRLLPKAKTLSVPKDKRVAARTPTTPKKIGFAHGSAFSGLKDHAGYTEFQYIRSSPSIVRNIDGHELPMLIDGGSEIRLTSEEVARELNKGWKRADWKMVTADGNQSDLMRVAESERINVNGMIIPMGIILAESGSEQRILGRPWETYTRNCERNLDDGRWEIIIPAVDGSEHVTFVASCPGDKKDRFGSSWGNFYTKLQ